MSRDVSPGDSPGQAYRIMANDFQKLYGFWRSRMDKVFEHIFSCTLSTQTIAGQLLQLETMLEDRELRSARQKEIGNEAKLLSHNLSVIQREVILSSEDFRNSAALYKLRPTDFKLAKIVEERKTLLDNYGVELWEHWDVFIFKVVNPMLDHMKELHSAVGAGSGMSTKRFESWETTMTGYFDVATRKLAQINGVLNHLRAEKQKLQELSENSETLPPLDDFEDE